MKSPFIKDKKRRLLFSRKEITCLILKTTIRNSLNSRNLRYGCIQKLQKLNRDCARVRITNRCTLTGSRKSVLRTFKTGRIRFREQLSYGLIPGFKKAAW
jgi:ribosomal protein S14